MNEINQFLTIIDGFIGGSQWFVFLLLGTGLFFTIYLKFPQFRYLRHSLFIVRGKFDQKSDEGDTSHFQALTTALSGTVGTGNIAGVALAIHLGGPAALFWMLVTAAVGMTTKFVEVTLSHKYREKAADGTIAGGPMYFMSKRLNIRLKNNKTIKTGKVMGALFAAATILSSFGTGNLPQINSISNSLFETFGINHILTGAVLSGLLALVILGGIRRIAKVTSRLVPIMAVFYFLGGILVIAYNIENLIPSILAVVGDVFTGTAATGGFLGGSIAFAFNRGVNRGLFSNEAGQGSAPIAHASARAHEPVSEGLVALLEPFIDTIIICFLTGLILLSSGVWTEKLPNKFQETDLIVLKDTYSETMEHDRKLLNQFLAGKKTLPLFSGNLTVSEGLIPNQPTMIHARSIAEEIRVWSNNQPYTGIIEFNSGKLISQPGLSITGNSLMHSAPLTAVAFTRSWLGNFGQYIVAIGLLLFAFSTTISWSYYGDRAVNYLFGIKGIVYYRIIFVIGYFLASFTDTTIVWTLSGVTIALMTIPNLIGILTLHKEMKTELQNFWEEWHEHFPGKNKPGI
ncbi:MAG: sodium:alanine symporter family protein [Mariniphaga sp.]